MVRVAAWCWVVVTVARVGGDRGMEVVIIIWLTETFQAALKHNFLSSSVVGLLVFWPAHVTHHARQTTSMQFACCDLLEVQRSNRTYSPALQLVQGHFKGHGALLGLKVRGFSVDVLQLLLSGLQLCKAIPKGKVSTYGAMAQVLQSSARAVGQVGWVAERVFWWL
jgi:O6-methylguanine-DNA--protein-cysteine methyltransferase